MTQVLDQDLICAIATPPGQGGSGIVRLSGVGAKQVAETICKRKLVARSAVYCQFVHGSEHLDDGIALWFPEPQSFTGEEVVELQGHGGARRARRGGHAQRGPPLRTRGRRR